MPMPPLLVLPDEHAYRAHFEAVYCQGPLRTFDGIEVRFRKRDFNHCCFESNRRTRRKARFSKVRSERLDWIKATLQDPSADLRVGWDSTRKRYDYDRRVAIVSGEYIVVIRLLSCRRKAQFVTAYLADLESTRQKIHTSPKWPS